MDATTYEKLETLLNDLLHNDLDVNEVRGKIEQTFSDSFLNKENTNTAYFQEFKTNIYLKDSNGLSLSLISGKGDIYGDMHSYNGSTISLHDVYNNEIYELYSENEFQQKTVTDLAQNLPNIMANREDFRLDWNTSKTDPFYLYTMDKSKINLEIIKPLLDNLWGDAYVRHSSDYDDYMISPYGGEDITVHPIAEHFLNLISKFNDFPEIVEAGNQYLVSQPEGIAFLNKEIKELNKQICYVENKETYRIINELDRKADPIVFELTNLKYSETFESVKKEAILDYQKAVTELESLQDKKYTLFDKFKNLPKKEYEYLAERVQISRENLDDILKMEQQENQTLHKLDEQLNDIQKEIEDILLKNNLPPLEFDIDYPLYLTEKFDTIMYPYCKNYDSNKARLEKYQSILNSGTNQTIIDSLENHEDFQNDLTDEIDVEMESEIITSIKM